MATSFKTSQIVLTKQIVIASGNMLLVNGVELIGGVSGNLIQTGVQLQTIIANTGSQAWSAANNNGINLSGALTATGVALINRDNSIGSTISGNLTTTGQTLGSSLTATGVSLGSSINSLSGFVGNVSGGLQAQITAGGGAQVKITGSSNLTLANFTGAGNISLSLSGASIIFISGDTSLLATNINLASTGQQAWTAANTNSIILSGNLTSTGIQLGNSIASLSGFVGAVSGGLQSQINTKASIATTDLISGNLRLTGVQLVATDIALSGFVGNVSGGLQAQIATRATIITTDLISGNLIQTGVQLVATNIALSGFIGNVSGGLQAQINTTVQIKVTGSSNLALANLTGAGNISLSVSGSSVVFISGDISTLATITNLTATGVALIARDNSIGSTISGNLTTTGQTLGTSLTASGVQLVATDVALSGFVGNVSGGLQAQINTAGQVKITGSANLTLSNFTGAGNVSIFTSGASIVFISGDTSLLATISNLASTGSQAWLAANNNAINLSGNLTQTGIQLIARDNSIGSTISGNLTSTGVQLGASINSLSGFVDNVSGGLQAQIGTRATITTTNLISGNLIQTGVQLGNSINSLSGFVGNVSGGLQAQINTAGQVKITGSSNLTLSNFTGAGNISLSVSGSSIVFISGDTSSLATIANLTATGVALINRDNSIGSTISGNLTATGVDLIARDNSIGSTISGNLTSTGVQLGASITSLSGFVGNVSGGLQAQIATTAQIKVTGSSNLALANLTGAGNISLSVSGASIVFISGDTSLLATVVNLASTGSQAWLAANNNGINLSGNLTQTGIQLINRDFLTSGILTTGLTNTGVLLGASISALSGFIGNVSGGLQAQITISQIDITGSSNVLNPNFTGVGNIRVSLSGNSIVFISGDTSLLATVVNLASTGSQAWNAANNNGINLSGNLTQTGIQLRNNDFLISGILATGLTNTGVLLVATDVALSGFLGNVSGGLQAQINTKASIVTTDLISGNLIQTGVQLRNNDFLISGILTTGLTNTGVLLKASIDALSGYVGAVSGGLQAQITAGGGATVNNLYLTGSNLYNLITGLSGLKTPSNLSYTSNSFNFTVTQPITSYFYTWSGLLPTGTGFLPTASTASGMDFTIKNKVITGNRLLISGNIDNLQNLLVYSLDSFTFKSDGQTWNII